jgi:mRNA interferase MazF
MKKGEIWVVDIPELGGHEQIGTRPAVIVADTKSSVVVIIPCTSNPQALRFPHTLLIMPNNENGLKTPSIALVLQIRAIDKRRLKKKIGFIGKPALSEIDKIARRLLKL